jgi:hypothetical protein
MYIFSLVPINSSSRQLSSTSIVAQTASLDIAKFLQVSSWLIKHPSAIFFSDGNAWAENYLRMTLTYNNGNNSSGVKGDEGILNFD